MIRQPLDIYEDIPYEMKAYLKNYGWHFSKKASEWASSLMKKMNPATNKMEKITPWKKEEVDELLKSNNITLDYNTGYDYVYVANMMKADFLNSSVPDEQHGALYIKDVIDDKDGADGMVFREWLAKLTALGIPIDWEDIL